MNKGNVIEIRCKKCNKLMMEYLDSRLKRLPADKQDYLKKTFDFMIEQALKSA